MTTITSYWAIDSIIVLMITIAVATYLYMTRNFDYWKKRGVFEIKPLPFFGNFLNFVLQKKPPVIVIKELYNRAREKPYMGFYVFDKPCLLIRDQEIIKDILVKDFNYFCNRNSKCNPDDSLSNASILFRKNPSWRIVRSKITPCFTSGKLKTMLDSLMECVVNLDTYLNTLKLEGKGKILDVRDLSGNLTTDMICKTAYGLNVNSVINPECELRKKGRNIFQFNIQRGLELFLIFFYPDFSRWFPSSFFGMEASAFLRNVLWDTINHRIESGQKRGDIIDTLIELRRDQAVLNWENFQFEGDDLVAQAAIFLTGGFETSSSTMSFALYELALHPEIQDKLRTEILEALNENDGQITYNMILSLPYLDMVVFEILRMYPILGTLDRETMESYKLSNHDLIIEKGTPVFISLLGLHFDQQYFPNPDEFDPERFNEENRSKISSFVYMPFGEGPRQCIGTRLGLLQVKLGILKILSRYKLTPCEKTVIPMILEPKSPGVTPLNGEIYLNVTKIDTY